MSWPTGRKEPPQQPGHGRRQASVRRDSSNSTPPQQSTSCVSFLKPLEHKSQGSQTAVRHIRLRKFSARCALSLALDQVGHRLTVSREVDLVQEVPGRVVVLRKLPRLQNRSWWLAGRSVRCTRDTAILGLKSVGGLDYLCGACLRISSRIMLFVPKFVSEANTLQQNIPHFVSGRKETTKGQPASHQDKWHGRRHNSAVTSDDRVAKLWRRAARSTCASSPTQPTAMGATRDRGEEEEDASIGVTPLAAS